MVKILTPEQQTTLEKQLKAQQAVNDNLQAILLYHPSYILPFYYTGNPYQTVYNGTTPLNQKVMSAELKANLSIQIPLAHHIFNNNDSINVSYDQLAYWQVYAKSQYFRETNYMPALFYRTNLLPILGMEVGVVHQSNGRGGKFERSWNRAFATLILSTNNQILRIRGWSLIFQSVSSDLHNPDITDYLGYGSLTYAYKYRGNVFSIMLRNQLESRFKRGAEQLTWSFPIHGHFRGFVQVFSGYGQSLIEYNHYTNSVGIGFSFNDWL